LCLAQELAGSARHSHATAQKLSLNNADAQAAAHQLCPDLDRRLDVGQAKHIHGQPRRHEIAGAMTLFDHRGEKTDDDAPVQRFRIPRAVRSLCRDESVAVAGEERLIYHGLRP
jgi:hypothetical protein